MTSASLSIKDLSFSYGADPVLRNLNLELRPGEVTALLGANGAGKSTLIKILSGVIAYGQFSGKLTWSPFPPGEGEGALRFSSPRDARAAGIVTIPQDASLFPDLSVAENLILEGSTGPQILNRSGIHARAGEILRRFDAVIPLEAVLGSLPLAQRQSVAILRAMAGGGRALLLDEPTAALPRVEADRLMVLCRRAASEGQMVVYVSHHLDEVFSVSDRIVALRNGTIELDKSAKDTDPEAVIEAMIGKAPGRGPGPHDSPLSTSPTPPPQGGRGYALELRDWSLSSGGHESRGPRFGLRLGRGEVVGLSGLAGSGKDDLIPSILGLQSRGPDSRLILENQDIEGSSPAALLERGLVLVPGDRARDGIFPDLSVARHLLSQVQVGLSPWCPLGSAEEIQSAAVLQEKFGVKAASLLLAITRLSGGNQQKVLMARAAAAGADIFLLDGPTRGVDVGARGDMYRWIRARALEGKTFLVASDDLDELSQICGRVLCFKDRTLRTELAGLDVQPKTLAANL